MVVTLPDKTKANPSEVQSSDMNMDMDSGNGNLNIISIFNNVYAPFEEYGGGGHIALPLSVCLVVCLSVHQQSTVDSISYASS